MALDLAFLQFYFEPQTIHYCDRNRQAALVLDDNLKIAKAYSKTLLISKL